MLMTKGLDLLVKLKKRLTTRELRPLVLTVPHCLELPAQVLKK